MYKINSGNSSLLTFACIEYLLKVYANPDSFIYTVNYDLKIDYPVSRQGGRTEEGLSLALKKPDIYIIHLNGNFEDLMKNLSNTERFNPRAKYLVLKENLEPISTTIFNYYFLLDVTVINIRNNVLTKYAYSKFRYKGICFDEKKLDIPIFEPSKPSIETTYTVCYFKLPPVQICSSYSTNCTQKGILLETVEMAFNSMNLTVNFEEHFLPGHGSSSILTGEDCQIYSIPVYMTLFDFTQPFFFDRMVWAVRIPNEKPRWTLALSIFDREIWLFWIFYTTIISFLWYFTSYVLGRRNNPKIIIVVLKTVVIYFLDQSRELNALYSTQLILKTLFIWLTFSMNLFYKGEFAYFLTGVDYEQPVSSFEDVMSSNFTVGLESVCQGLFEDNNDIMEYFNGHLKECRFEENCLGRVAEENNYAYLIPEYAYYFTASEFLDERGNCLVRLLDTPVLTIINSIVIAKGHPLTLKLDQQLTALVQHGFVNKIIGSYKKQYVDYGSYLRVEKLDMSSVKLLFRIWIIGNILGIVTFLKEFFEDNRRQNFSS